MNTDQKLRVQKLATEIISTVLDEMDSANLASQEQRAADMVATALVEWNRGKISKEQLRAVTAATNDILEAVRRRRQEIVDGKTSL